MDLNRSDHPYIDDLQMGDRFDGYFVMRSLQMMTTRANKPFLVFDFTDRTGHIKGKMWDDAEYAYKGLTPGDVVKVRATVEEYLGKAELKVLRIRPIDPDDITDFSRFLPTSESDTEENLEIIKAAITKIAHPGIQNLLTDLFDDHEFVEKYIRTPAGKKWHHGYLGGLLEHAASMTGLAQNICDHYPDLNRDLIIAGTILHDIGKIWELSSETAIDYTTEGRLLGHIVLGAEFIAERGKSTDDLDEETLMLLRHMILSHQGALEHGCPVLPMTKEAMVLYHIDEIDSKLNAMTRELDKASGGGGDFTEYINLLGRMLYKGKQEE